MPFNPVNFELGLIHSAATNSLIDEKFLGLQEPIAASRELTQNECVLLYCYNRFLQSNTPEILSGIFSIQHDYWRDAFLKYQRLEKEGVVKGMSCIAGAFLDHTRSTFHYLEFQAKQTGEIRMICDAWHRNYRQNQRREWPIEGVRRNILIAMQFPLVYKESE